MPFDFVEHYYGNREWMIVDPLNLKALQNILERARYLKFNHPPSVGTISFDIRMTAFIDKIRTAIKKLDPESDL